jgi:2'-5' RNA ligase
MFRAFIAVEIESSPELEEFSRAVKGTEAPLKMVNLDIIHVTMKFLGDTDEALIPQIEEVMKKAVEGIEPFTVKITGTGAFPNLNRLSVIWAGMENAETLGRIAEILNKGLEPLGFRQERKKFSPHVTIARVKGGRNKDRLVEVIHDFENKEFGTFEVNRIILKKSVLTTQGPIYTDMSEVNL